MGRAIDHRKLAVAARITRRGHGEVKKPWSMGVAEPLTE